MINKGIKSCIICVLFITHSIAQTQDFSWAIATSGSGFAYANDITTDFERNIYVTGNFSKTVDFDPGPDIASWTSEKSQGAFIQKLDTNGYLLWVKAFTSPEYYNDVVLSHAVTTDQTGNVYITGNYRGTVDFDPGISPFFLTSSGNYSNPFVLKLDSNGNFVWVKTMEYSARGSSIAVNASGNVYFTLFGGILIKLDENGNVLWSKSTAGSCDDLTLDSNSNVYICGYYTGMTVFSQVDSLTSNGQEDAYIQKLDSSGNHLWVKTWGGLGDDYCNSIALDNDQNICVNGYFYSTVDFDPDIGVEYRMSEGSVDAYVLKLSNSGDFIWVNTFGSNSSDGFYSIAVDELNNVYSSGFFSNTITINTPEPTTMIPNGHFNVFALKNDSSGNVVWAKSWGANHGYGITVDPIGNVYLTGDFYGCVDFGSAPGESNLCADHNGPIFVLRLGWPADPYVPIIPLEIKVYPSRVLDYVTIAQTKPTLLTIAIYDLFGKIIESLYSTELKTEIDMSQYAGGMYAIHVQSENDVLLKLITKQ